MAKGPIIKKNNDNTYNVNGTKATREQAVKVAEKSPNHHNKTINGKRYPASNPDSKSTNNVTRMTKGHKLSERKPSK